MDGGSYLSVGKKALEKVLVTSGRRMGYVSYISKTKYGENYGNFTLKFADNFTCDDPLGGWQCSLCIRPSICFHLLIKDYILFVSNENTCIGDYYAAVSGGQATLAESMCSFASTSNFRKSRLSRLVSLPPCSSIHHH
ncbi:unnamed protein product [Musa acuminata var. zebrina]